MPDLECKKFVESFRNIMNSIDTMSNGKMTQENVPIKILCDWGRKACEIIEIADDLLRENTMEVFSDDISKIYNAMRAFEDKMEQRMFDKHREGFRGWDNFKDIDLIIEKFHKSIEKMNWVDVANFAMMLDRFKNLKE